MKKYTIMFLCLFALFFSAVCPGVYGQGSDADLKKKVDKMEEMLNELKGQLKQQTEATDELMSMREEIKNISAPTAPTASDDDFYWAKKSQDLVDKGLAPVFGRQYGKPFLRRFGRHTYIGGYMDHELQFSQGQGKKKGKDTTFDQHRLIPFIYSDVSDRVKFATEIEIEHGGPSSATGGDIAIGDGGIEIEFATIDFLMTDWFNYRGGVILSPLGKFNLVHDSPLQDLTERPMVSTNIIPTTLSESGMGFFGTFYPTEISKLDYEIYAVNGFQALEDDGTRSTTDPDKYIRNSRGSYSKDNNTNFAIVGRLAYSPFLGLEIGGSFHTGTVDERNRNRLTITALDWTYQRGPFELVGEMARAHFNRDGVIATGAQVSDLLPGDSFGYYVEPRYHFMPQFLKDLAPTVFTENSTFTGVVRLGEIDLGTVGNGNGERTRTRLTPGINFRYTEDTVFKAEYQFNWESGRAITDETNNVLLFSVATYF
ncbi:MAG: hypothetical protein NUV86_07455 [Candidatus Scalindua sp.]|nr:hypothetical protein [Candidatus Scalindua sp.]